MKQLFSGTHCTNESWNGCICAGAICSSCNNGYFMQIDQDPTKNHCCSFQCGSCENHNNASICLTCAQQGHYYSPNDSSCKKCPNDCPQCSYNQAQGTVVCTGCKFDIKSEGYLNSLCVGCPQDCNECFSVNGILQCQQCKDGFYLTSSYQCISCGQNCQKCEQDATLSQIIKCTQCKQNYALSAQGTCLQCPEKAQEGCIDNRCVFNTAILSNQNVPLTTCEECRDGTEYKKGDIDAYVKNNKGVCEKCQIGCIQCQYNQDSNESRCKKCIDYFLFYEENEVSDTSKTLQIYALTPQQSCVECNIPGCGKCEYVNEGNFICTRCRQQGYYYQLNTKSCVSCGIEKCSKCEEKDGIIECQGCVSGFYPENKVCTQCPKGCENTSCQIQQEQNRQVIKCGNGTIINQAVLKFLFHQLIILLFFIIFMLQ